MLAQRWPEAAQTARRQGAPFVMPGNDGGDALVCIPKLAKACAETRNCMVARETAMPLRLKYQQINRPLSQVRHGQVSREFCPIQRNFDRHPSTSIQKANQKNSIVRRRSSRSSNSQSNCKTSVFEQITGQNTNQ